MATSKAVRFQVLKDCGFTCRYCGRKAPDVVLEVDHSIPKAAGGTDDYDNLTAACVDCNRGKSDTRIVYDAIIQDCLMADDRCGLDGPATALDTLVQGVLFGSYLLEEEDYQALILIRDKVRAARDAYNADPAGYHQRWRERRSLFLSQQRAVQ